MEQKKRFQTPLKGVETVNPIFVPDRLDVARAETPPPKALPMNGRSNQTLSQPKEAFITTLAKALAAQEIDPIEELVTMYKERDEEGNFVMSRGERSALMKDLLQYIHPKLKAVEHRGQEDRSLTVVLVMPDGTSQQRQVERRGDPIDV